jgi:hypothetical protein
MGGGNDRRTCSVSPPTAGARIVLGAVFGMLFEPFLVAHAAPKIPPRTVGPAEPLVKEIVERPMQCVGEDAAHPTTVAAGPVDSRSAFAVRPRLTGFENGRPRIGAGETSHAPGLRRHSERGQAHSAVVHNRPIGALMLRDELDRRGADGTIGARDAVRSGQLPAGGVASNCVLGL